MRSSRKILLLALAIVFAIGGIVAPRVIKGLGRRQIELEIRQAGGSLHYDCDFSLPGGGVSLTNRLAKLLGSHFVGDIQFVYLQGRSNPVALAKILRRLRGLSALETLDLTDSAIDAECAQIIGELKSLRVVRLGGFDKVVPAAGGPALPAGSFVPEITPAVLDPLAGLPELVSLELKNAHAAAVSLASLRAFPKLSDLDLKGTQLTAAELAQLADLPCLACLHVSDDVELLKAVRRALPDVNVVTY
jgi:hypothetical protein